MANNLLITGNKAVKIRMEDLSEDAWTYLVGGTDKSGAESYYKSVPWLYRGVMMRAQAVSSMPYEIRSGETVLETIPEFMDDAIRLFWLTEAALTLLGLAYIEKTNNLAGSKTLDLRYLQPNSITPKFDKQEGLTGFTRGLGNQEIVYSPDEILYFWYPDPYVEIGPPMSSPVMAALNAAGVLSNVDLFASKFFERGAIKATILGVPAGTPEPAKQELKTWWDKVIAGINNAFTAKVVNADAIEATTIGEGVDSLNDTELTKEKREDIATSLGIPQTKLFSNAANYATARQDDIAFYKETIVPECNFIQGVLNKQVFEPMGLEFVFLPETLDVFQVDEAQRSDSLVNLVNAGMPLEVALRTLGFELDNEDWVIIEDEKQAREEMTPPEPDNQRVIQVDSDEADLRSHLNKWRRKSSKSLKRGEGAAVEFESEFISPALNAAIYGALEGAETITDINTVFSDSWMGYP